MRKTIIAATLASFALIPAAVAQQTIVVQDPSATVVTEQPITSTTTVVTEQPATRVIELPPQVRTYVTQQNRPSVVLEGPVVVGQPLPDTVEYQVIPDNDGYAYTVINGQKVIVDPKTRSVIEVYD